MRAEVLIDPTMANRGAKMLAAMIEAAPIPVLVRQKYVGDCEILLTYGTGHPVRRPWWIEHRKKGGRCIGLDLGYWAREDNGTFSMRATIDDDHPHKLIRPEAPQRWDSQNIALRSDYDANGPILLIGMGQKSVKAYRYPPLGWEMQAFKNIRATSNGKQVLFRPKRITDRSPAGLQRRLGPIEEALKGSSLVVCRHSNVAVDACIAGIPVICDDGAALALYKDNPNPSPEQRLEFMRSLAWWQYKPEEAETAWKYLISRLSA